MQFTLKQVQYFLAAAETGQFSAAAAKVHVTQTAITAAIRELETALGVALFERHHAAGVSLTVAGQQFLLHAQGIKAAVDAALEDPGLFRQTLTGCLRLAATHSILGSYLVPTLARFTRAYPLIQVEVQELQRAKLERSLLDGKNDLGVAWLKNLQSTALGTLPLTRSRRQLWLPAHHPLLDQRAITLKDVHPLPYAMYGSDETPENTRQLWQRARLEPNVRYRATSIEAIRSLVAQGLAVTILADVIYRPFSSEGLRIETRPLIDAVPAIEIGLCWQSKREPSPPAAAFTAFARQAFATVASSAKLT
ncbi:MAG: LysR family transcriptional regulator [Polyangiaceae bacterium]